MDNSIILNKELTTNSTDDFNLLSVSNELLQDAKYEVLNKTSISVPIAELATLGGGAASLLPIFRTVKNSTTFNTEGLYRLTNEVAGDILKKTKDGDYWAGYKTAEGKSKMVRLKEAGEITAESASVIPVNPATMMMAVALYSIEKDLGNIKDSINDIRSTLQIEKEAEVESNLATLNDILEKYKFNWHNDKFITGNLGEVINIKRTARKNIKYYEKKIKELLNVKKIIVLKSKVDELLKEFISLFSYYRMSLYSYSMATFIEVLLEEEYTENVLTHAKMDIQNESLVYRNIYNETSILLENLTDKAIEQNLLEGVGIIGEKAGKLIGKIPVVKEGPVDELLQAGGAKLDDIADSMVNNVVESFAKLSNPRINVFIDKMDDMIQIYGHTEMICYDSQRLYLVGA